jgi:hypothetical protein
MGRNLLSEGRAVAVVVTEEQRGGASQSQMGFLTSSVGPVRKNRRLVRT